MFSHRLSVLLVLLPLGCSKSTDDQPGPGAVAPDAGPTLSAAERELLTTLSPLPTLPKDATNRFADNAAAAVLGQRLFFDVGYSGPLAVGDDGKNGALGAVGAVGVLSCASCHLGAGLDDKRSQPAQTSLGANWLARNAPGLVNSSYYRWVNWAGRFSAQWELPLAVAESPINMNGNRLRIAHRIFDTYRSDYEAVFGALDPALGTDAVRFPPAGKPKANAMADDGVWEKMSDADRLIVNTVFVNFGKALAAYMRTLISRASRFDAFAAGDAGKLSASERRGLELFAGKGQCIACHTGPRFTDDGFHFLGLPQTGNHVPMVDNGRFADVPPLLNSAFNSAGAFSDDRAEGAARLMGLVAMPGDETKGQFRTPSLRNVGQTAPYMHAGQLATLEDVVAYYVSGGSAAAPGGGTKDPLLKPLSLTAGESADLVAFLRALDMEPVPAALLQNTAKK